MERRAVLLGLAASVVAGRQVLSAVAPARYVEPEPQTPCEVQEWLRRNYLLSAHVFKLIPDDQFPSQLRCVRLGRLHARATGMLFRMAERGLSEPEIDRIKQGARKATNEDYGTSSDPFLTSSGFALLCGAD